MEEADVEVVVDAELEVDEAEDVEDADEEVVDVMLETDELELELAPVVVLYNVNLHPPPHF